MKKAIFTAAIMTLAALSAQAVPKILNYQGFLTEAGNPVTGTRDMTFQVFDAPELGAELFTEVHSGVTVTDGNFNVLVGELTAGGIASSVFDGNDRYMEVTVGPTVLPRQRIVSVAYSIRTETASGLDSAGDILITPTGNVGIGTALPTAKLDVVGAIEHLAKPLLRFTRAQSDSSESDATKDSRCSAEFGPAYAAASSREGMMYLSAYINLEPLMTFAGHSNRLVITEFLQHPMFSPSQNFGAGPSFLACVQKTAPVRFTRTRGSTLDGDALKDGRCSTEFGPNYMAATILDVNSIPGGIGGLASFDTSFAVAGSQFHFSTDIGRSLVEDTEGSGLNEGGLEPVACIHK